MADTTIPEALTEAVDNAVYNCVQNIRAVYQMQPRIQQINDLFRIRGYSIEDYRFHIDNHTVEFAGEILDPRTRSTILYISFWSSTGVIRASVNSSIQQNTSVEWTPVTGFMRTWRPVLGTPQQQVTPTQETTQELSRVIQHICNLIRENR